MDSSSGRPLSAECPGVAYLAFVLGGCFVFGKGPKKVSSQKVRQESNCGTSNWSSGPGWVPLMEGLLYASSEWVSANLLLGGVECKSFCLGLADRAFAMDEAYSFSSTRNLIFSRDRNLRLSSCRFPVQSSMSSNQKYVRVTSATRPDDNGGSIRVSRELGVSPRKLHGSSH
jgi:hypothetical protein